MISIPKTMLIFGTILAIIVFWTTSNVCRYNFTIEKRTNELNIIAAEIDPSIPMARVYYFSELNCNKVDLSWDIDRVVNNFQILSVEVYQQLTTDIRGNPNY
jgi:hypothetical protein